MIYKKLKAIEKNFCLGFLLLSITFLIIGCEQEISTSPIEPEPQKGKIVFDSNPQGFTIFINGRNTGSITPDSLSFLDADNYQITLKKKYYKDSVFTLELLQDERKNLFIDFISNPTMYGKINLFSIPAGASGANVHPGGASGVNVLNACLRISPCTRVEKLFSAGPATTGTVTGEVLVIEGDISYTELIDMTE